MLNDSGMFRAFNRVSTRTIERLTFKAMARGLNSSRAFSRSEQSHLPSVDTLVTVQQLDCYYEELMLRYRPAHSGGWMTAYAGKLDFSSMLDLARSHELTLARLFQMTYEQLVVEDRTQVRFLGEKTPEHLYLAPWLLRNYPEAHFVVLIREPITNIAAMMKRSYASRLRTAVALYLSSFSSEFQMVCAAPNSVVVRYEDLIADTREALASVYGHLGLPTSETPVDLSNTARQSYVGATIDPERDARLRASVPGHDRRVIQRSCRSVYERFYPGVEVSGDG